LVGICIVLLSCRVNENTYVEKQNFNNEWNFKLLTVSEIDSAYFQKNINSNSWEKIQLPHTPKLEPEIVNDQWQGICWYRKNFNLTDNLKGKRLYVKFEGAMNIAEVWVNGEKLVMHQGGYLPFVVDFTHAANFDQENTIAVKLDNRDNPITGPKPLNLLDFNTYGGLYRNVWFIAKDALHITDPILENKPASGGVFVTYPEVSKEIAKVHIQTHVRNENAHEVSFMVKNTLLKNNIEIVSISSEPQNLGTNSAKELVVEMQVNNPELWSPGTPNLYHLKTEIIQDGKVVDQEITRIGIKTMKFVGQDFYLNGQKTFLRGVFRAG